MPVIDFHAHVFPDDLAARAIAGMVDRTHMRAHYDGTVAGLIGAMDRAGVDVSVIAPVATKPSQVRSINDWTARLTDPRFVRFGAIHPRLDDATTEIARIARLGFKGVKLHPEFQAFRPDEPRMTPVYEACAEHGLIVLFHAGEDPNFETVSGTPDVFLHLVERYPSVTFVLAHMGGYRRWDEVAEHLIGAPVHLDTSHATELLAPEELVSLARRHGVERVLFASDGPWTDAASALRSVRDAGFTDEELEGVLGGNAVRLLGIES